MGILGSSRENEEGLGISREFSVIDYKNVTHTAAGKIREQYNAVASVDDFEIDWACGSWEFLAFDIVHEDGICWRVVGGLAEDVRALTLVIEMLSAEVDIVRITITIADTWWRENMGYKVSY